MGSSLSCMHAARGMNFQFKRYQMIVEGRAGCKHHLTIARRKDRKNSRFLRMECKKCNVRFYLSKWRIHKLTLTPGYKFDITMVERLWLPSGYTAIMRKKV